MELIKTYRITSVSKDRHDRYNFALSINDLREPEEIQLPIFNKLYFSEQKCEQYNLVPHCAMTGRIISCQFTPHRRSGISSRLANLPEDADTVFIDRIEHHEVWSSGGYRVNRNRGLAFKSSSYMCVYSNDDCDVWTRSYDLTFLLTDAEFTAFTEMDYGLVLAVNIVLLPIKNQNSQSIKS